MSKYQIDLEVRRDEAHSELLNQVELADLSFEESQQARTGVNAALSFLNVVGDASVDTGVAVRITGEAGAALTVEVSSITAPEPEPRLNDVTDDDDVVTDDDDVDVSDTNPHTGDPLVDNVPGAVVPEDDASEIDPSVLDEKLERIADAEVVDES